MTVPTADLETLVGSARPLVESDPELEMFLSLPPGTAGKGSGAGAGFPEEYRRVIEISNGPLFGRVVIFDERTAADMQDWIEQSTAGSEQELDRRTWFCAGLVNDNLLLLNLSSREIWGFPGVDRTWWIDGRLVRLAGNLDDFLTGTVFSARNYADLVGDTTEDHWLELLRRLEVQGGSR